MHQTVKGKQKEKDHSWNKETILIVAWSAPMVQLLCNSVFWARPPSSRQWVVWRRWGTRLKVRTSQTRKAILHIKEPYFSQIHFQYLIYPLSVCTSHYGHLLHFAFLGPLSYSHLQHRHGIQYNFHLVITHNTPSSRRWRWIRPIRWRGLLSELLSFKAGGQVGSDNGGWKS